MNIQLDYGTLILQEMEVLLFRLFLGLKNIKFIG